MPRYRTFRHGSRRGTILLLALLVLSTVSAAAGGLGTLMLNSLQQSRLVDSSAMAYYAAESGAEDALYRLRVDNVMPGEASPERPGVYITGQTDLPNGGKWNREIAGSEAAVITDIPGDSFVEFLLYDPDNEGVLPADPIQAVYLSWAPMDCTAELCPHLIVSRVSWMPGATVWNEDGAWTKMLGQAENGTTISLLPANRLHKLRLRAEGATFRGVRVEAIGSSGPVKLPGRAKIDVWGRFGESQQHLTVSVPRRMPLGGMFDFALFSECSIVKGFPIRCP